MPREGMSRKEYFERKFGGGKTVEEMNRRMLAVGAQEGIPFALDKIEKTPNTFDAHRLAWFGDRQGRGEEVVNGLFRAFFTEGRDIGDRAVLAEVAAGAGLDRAEAERFLASEEGTQEVRADERRARERGVDAVPTFIIGGKVAVTGAQSPEVFLEAFRSL
jgi:predicted DsbA family dithiol-disulfide isomerase